MGVFVVLAAGEFFIYTISMKVHSYTVQIEPAQEGGFWSRVASLPGCFSQGETIEETMTNTKEAIELYLEGLVAEKSDIPEESDFVVSVRIPVSI